MDLSIEGQVFPGLAFEEIDEILSWMSMTILRSLWRVVVPRGLPTYFENVYREETKAFFDYLHGKVQPWHSLMADKKTLNLIDKIDGK